MIGYLKRSILSSLSFPQKGFLFHRRYNKMQTTVRLRGEQVKILLGAQECIVYGIWDVLLYE